MIAEQLKRGIALLQQYGFLQEGLEGITLRACPGDELKVEKSETSIHITYDTVPHFYMALARSLVMGNGIHTIERKVERLGLMMDCSRNAVAKPEMAKRVICLLVLAGYDYLELYTEDTYELPGEPYFGYGRGRYHAEELKEIIAFADEFEFEMVPCIQTLAHLKKLANWLPYFEHMDINDILLVDDERTYNLIRKCLRFCREIFHTKRINIGGDEADTLGLGKYRDIHGEKPKHELYLKHMKKVFELCKEEGFEPEFWADGLYRKNRYEGEKEKLFDGTQTPIVWKYGYSAMHAFVTQKELTKELFERMRGYAGKVMYAGTLFKFYGYAPYNEFSYRAMNEYFAAVEECNVDHVLMTAWGDDGCECSVYAVMPSLWYAANKLYPCDVNLSALIEYHTGYSKEEWELCDKLNFVRPEVDKVSNAVRYILHNDFLIGLLDYNTPDDAGETYQRLLTKFNELAKKDSQFAYLFASYAAICQVLTRKATYGKRLYRAYQSKDMETMRSMIDEIMGIKADLQEFHRIYRNQWMRENKGYGFEVIDVRIGGLISRVDTVVALLTDYLEEKTEKIYELEEERLEYFSNQLVGDEVYAPVHGHWATTFTINVLY